MPLSYIRHSLCFMACCTLSHAGCNQSCCYSGRLFSSLFGSHDHHPKAESPRSHGEQPVSSPAAESASHDTQAAGPGTRSVVADVGRSRQQGPEGVGDDGSMAETGADLHKAQQAQREALQAEQESLSGSRQNLMQVQESVQHQQPGMLRTIAISQAVCCVLVPVASVEIVCLSLCCCLGVSCLHLEAGLLKPSSIRHQLVYRHPHVKACGRRLTGL